MKKLILLLFLVYTAKSYALNFEDLHGCFKTIDVNGSSVQNGPIRWRNQTQLEDLGNRSYKDIRSRENLQISALTVFRGYRDPYYRYNPFVIMHDRGEMIETESSFEYTVDEDFLLSNYGIYKKVDHYMNLKLVKNSDNTISGKAIYISNIRKHNREVNFTIGEQECL